MPSYIYNTEYTLSPSLYGTAVRYLQAGALRPYTTLTVLNWRSFDLFIYINLIQFIYLIDFVYFLYILFSSRCPQASHRFHFAILN